MVRAPCCAKVGMNRGAWSHQEDRILTAYINVHGEGNWRSLPQKAGLNRCGKSCRLRWLNYLKPGIKRGSISKDEETLIVKLHNLLGNRWSLIAGRLPGRTDNEIKNYWNTTLTKKLYKGDQTRGSRNANDQQRSNSNKKAGKKPAKEPTEVPPPRVIKTRAFRCNKVIIIPSAAAAGGEECHHHRITEQYNNFGDASLKISSSPPTSGNEENDLMKNDLELTDDASPDNSPYYSPGNGGGEMVQEGGDNIFQFSSDVPVFDDYEAGFLESWATCASAVDHVGLELDKIASFLDLGEEWKVL